VAVQVRELLILPKEGIKGETAAFGITVVAIAKPGEESDTFVLSRCTLSTSS